MPTTLINVRGWIEKSDIDYTTYFIKAWIPFNAWYDLEYYNQPALNSDRAKINEIKRNPNTVRNGINTYLENNDQDCVEFRNRLSALHHALQQTQLDGNDGRISFHQIVKEKNAVNQIIETSNNIRYFLKRTDGDGHGNVTQMQVTISDRHNNAICNYQHTAYNLEHLQANQNFQNLSQARRDNARIRFERLHPITVIDSIRDVNERQDAPLNYYECDLYTFKRDAADAHCPANIVCRAVIETLYQLRNQLFHGELVPNQAVQPIYQNAYFLLKLILEKVR